MRWTRICSSKAKGRRSEMAGMRLSLTRTMWLACCGAMLAPLVGCGGAVRRPEESMPLTRHDFRRFSGGTARIYDAAKLAMDKMGALVTGERAAKGQIHGKLDIARQPVHLYVKVAGGNRVYVTVYNLKKKEADEWRMRFYEAMEAAIRGAPSERPRAGGRGRRG